MDHHLGDLLLACGWNWMISCRGWGGVTGGCAPKPEGESVYSIWSRTPSIHWCAKLCCDQETSHNIITYLWLDMKSYISISLDIWEVSYAFDHSNLQAWFHKNAIIWATQPRDSSLFKLQVTLMLHFRALCLFMCLFLGNFTLCLLLWSFWRFVSFTFSY